MDSGTKLCGNACASGCLTCDNGTSCLSCEVGLYKYYESGNVLKC